MRTGIALGRPLVPRMGQMFQWPGGGVPQFTPLSAQQAGIPLNSSPRPPIFRRLDEVPWSWDEECAKAWIRTHPEYSSYFWNSEELIEIMKETDAYAYSVCSGRLKYRQSQMPSAAIDGLRLQGLGLGSKNSLGAGGIPLLASSIVSIPLQAAATWVGFHTGSEETGWLSAAGYVVGIVGAIGTLVGLLGLVVGTAAEVA